MATTKRKAPAKKKAPAVKKKKATTKKAVARKKATPRKKAVAKKKAPARKKAITKKSKACTEVLRLMDKDYSYSEALKIVLSINKNIDRKKLEKELDKYI